MTRLFIKNMVCDRCKAAVTNELTRHKISFRSVELGEVEVDKAPSAAVLGKFKTAIENLGFELIEDRGARLVGQIKSIVIDWVRVDESRDKRLNFSTYLAEKLGRDYSALSSLFSSVEGTTVEQYLIHQKIERAKELLVYGEFTLNEIADQLNYSSVQHLSMQFKKITGLTPSHFKKVGASKRLGLDKV